MNVIDKFLGLKWPDDITETTWWADTVFRELEEGLSDVFDSDVAAATTHQSSEPN